jgi:hypothetical protein
MGTTGGKSTRTALVLSPTSEEQEGDALVVLEEIQTKLTCITTVNEAKELADQAAALRDYAKRTRKALVVQNHCAWVRVVAERRAGELIRDMDLLKGRPEKASSASRLSEFDISYNQSSYWQALTKVPFDLIEQWRRGCDNCQEEFTSAYVRRMMKGVLSPREHFEATHGWESYDTKLTYQSFNRLGTEVSRFATSLQGGRLWSDAFAVLDDPNSAVAPQDLISLIRQFQVLQDEVSLYIEKLRRRAERLPVKWDKKTPGLLELVKPTGQHACPASKAAKPIAKPDDSAAANLRFLSVAPVHLGPVDDDDEEEVMPSEMATVS